MIFPQNEEGVGVVFEAGEQSQGGACLVYGYGGGACRIHRNGFYTGCCCGAYLFQAAPDGLFQSFDVIQGMLSELVVIRAAIEAVLPAGVIEYGGGNLA